MSEDQPMERLRPLAGNATLSPDSRNFRPASRTGAAPDLVIQNLEAQAFDQHPAARGAIGVVPSMRRRIGDIDVLETGIQPDLPGPLQGGLEGWGEGS